MEDNNTNAAFPNLLFPEKVLVHTYENVDLNLSNIRTLIIVDHFEDEASERNQIAKIFAACKLSEEEFFITDKKLPWTFIQRQNMLREVFLFALDPKDIAINYQLFRYRFVDINNKKIMLTDGIKTIMNNNQLKLDFWNKCLKPHFIHLS